MNANVFWAQTEERVSLKVDLKEVRAEKVLFTADEVHYASQGLGAKGENEYRFSLPLYSEVDAARCSYRVSATRVDLLLAKRTAAWWPRLTRTPQKEHWLKIDFDKWRPSREDEDAFSEEERARPLLQDYPEARGRVEREELGYRREGFRRAYLGLYNTLMFVGFLYVLLVLAVTYAKRGPDALREAFASAGKAMQFLQLLQFLEVLHSVFGYTRNSPLVPLLQTSGRAFVLFAMLEAEPRMQDKPVVFYLFVVWAAIEVVRYPYYFLNLALDGRAKLSAGFRGLQWLRYSAWIPLYPLGVLCEGVVVLRNVVYFEETGRFSVELPNRWNFTWDMVLFLKAYLLVLLLPGIYFMMRHMAQERAKRLNPKRRD